MILILIAAMLIWIGACSTVAYWRAEADYLIVVLLELLGVVLM